MNRVIKSAIAVMAIYTIILIAVSEAMSRAVYLDKKSYVDHYVFSAEELDFVPQDPWTLQEAGIAFGEKKSDKVFRVIVVDYDRVYYWLEQGAAPMVIYQGKYYRIIVDHLGLSAPSGPTIFTYLTFIGVLGWTATIAAAVYLHTRQARCGVLCFAS